MSNIDCGACNDLREYAPHFVQNGITDTECNSLKNDTGLNPSLATLQTDCEDLNDVNDCLVGRMDGELEAYEVCDWKKFMHKFIPNLYETIKGIICSICGLWTKSHDLDDKTDRLCTSIDALLGLIRGSYPTPHYGTWTDDGYASLHNGEEWDKDKFKPILYADILDGFGCNDNRRLGRWTLGIGYSENTYPRNPFFYMQNYRVGDIWAYWRKSDIVPTYMSEARWESLMRGYNAERFSMYGGASGKILYLAVRGYIIINGVVFNEDLRDTFGEDVMVMEVRQMVGGNGDEPFTGTGDIISEVISYDVY